MIRIFRSPAGKFSLSILAVVTIFELGARVYTSLVGRPRGRIYEPSPSISDLGSLAYRIKIKEPEQLKTPAPIQKTSPPQSVKCSPQLVTPHPDVGTVLTPGSQSTCRKTGVNGETVGEYSYSTDAFGRRVTPHPERTERPHQIITLGCSFTFGEGVQDHETLSAHLANSQSDYQVFNYSAPGWSPGNVLARLESPALIDELPAQGEKVVIYTFIDHHLNRLIGSLDVFQAFMSWPSVLPSYHSKPDGRVVRGPMHFEVSRIETWPLFVIGRSHLLSHLGIQKPLSLDSSHFQLWANVVNQMREEFVQRWGPIRFYVVFFPLTKFGPTLTPYLDRLNIHSIDYGSWQLRNYLDSPPFLQEGHPSSATYQFLAKQILKDIDIPLAPERDKPSVTEPSP